MKSFTFCHDRSEQTGFAEINFSHILFPGKLLPIMNLWKSLKMAFLSGVDHGTCIFDLLLPRRAELTLVPATLVPVISKHSS